MGALLGRPQSIDKIEIRTKASRVSANLIQKTTDKYRAQYGADPEVISIAPGRVNLIGEHVDYNDGYVLPMAIDRHIVSCVGRASDAMHHFASGDFEPVQIDAAAELTPGEPFWTNYVKGVIAGFQARQIQVPPLQATFGADLPVGGGLSSSAAIEVGFATALESLTGQQLQQTEKPLLCQKAEHDFAGVPCGIMDQFAVALAKENNLLLLDCRTQEIEHVPFTNPDIAVVIANTNVSHSLADGEYGKRRAQCEEAAKALGIDSLRDASWMQLEMSKDKMSEVVFRRARHVITEIERTANCANRLQAGEWTAVASLLFASHDSLREDYEVSCEELDTLVDIARSPDFDGLVYGSRMTGGGFGGSTVSLVHRDILDRFCETLSNDYKAKTGIEATVFVTKPSAGAQLA